MDRLVGGARQAPTAFPSPMTYEDSIRILLHGLTGANTRAVGMAVGLSRLAVSQFLSGQVATKPATVDRIATFVFRRMNAAVLLSPEDLSQGADAR